MASKKRGKSQKKAWVVAVDMGYGHQRAAYPLRDIAFDKIINANSDKLLSPREIAFWRRHRSFYEGISKLTSVPIIGKFLFNFYDRFQAIAELYPFRDLSSPTLESVYCRRLIEKKKINGSMMSYMKSNGLPIITTFFFPAFAAEFAGIKKVYCIITDTDVNRIWIAADPKKSKIIYFAPCHSAVKRLKEYGVPEERLILTGFPLPKENLGGPDLRILKKDLGLRMPNLDPRGQYPKIYGKLAKQVLGKNYKNKSNRRLTLTYCVGGAGAQTEIGYTVLKSLRNKIKEGKIKINISVGTRVEVGEYFKSKIKQLGLEDMTGTGIDIIFAWSKPDYFKLFNQALRTTDILWTKPSELSFYTALGIPIIMAPPIGAHEYRNQKWLLDMGAGIPQEKPEYTEEWLTDLLENGRLADAAMQGFLEAPKLGTYEIENIVLGRTKRSQ